MWIIVGLMFLALSFGVLVLLLYGAAKNKQQATFVDEGTIEFVVAGGKLVKTFVNVDGFALTKSGKIKPLKVEGDATRSDEIPETSDEIAEESWLARQLRERWGFYWVSLFYPWVRIHKFEITKERLRTRGDIPDDTPLRARIEHEKDPVKVDNLFFRFPRPYFFGSVETSDRFTTDVIVQVIFQIVDPYIPVFLYRGKFFSILETVVSGCVIDFLRSRTYTEFVAIGKGKDSPFSTFVKELNTRPTLNSPGGIIADFGIVILDAWVEEFSPAKGEKDVQDATKARELAILRGDADVEKAKRDGKAAGLRTAGATAEIRQLGRAYGKMEPETARIVSAQIVSRNLGQGSLRVLAGNGLTPTINVDSDEPKEGGMRPSRTPTSKASKPTQGSA